MTYRIVEVSYESGDIRYQIQQKILFWWFNIPGEYWERKEFAQERVCRFVGNKVITKRVVE